MHEWDRGVLNESSWHGLEEIGFFQTAEDMINHGERSGAWPVTLTAETLQTSTGIDVDGQTAMVGRYQAHPARVLGVNGKRYHNTTPANWRSLCNAAVQAGAKPTGAFSLRQGRVVLATFEVNGRDDGIATNLMLCDSFDGSQRLSGGTTGVRVVCANTMTAAFQQDGAGMAKLRHTSTLNDQISILRGEIAQALKTGEKLRELYRKASNVELQRDQALAVFNQLFPEPPADASKQLATRLTNNRTDATRAAVLPVNRVGSKGNLATLWNAATFLVDREADGTKKETKGDSDMLDSLLFGQRGKRVAEVHSLIESILSVPEVQIGALLKSLTAPTADMLAV